MPQTEDTKSLVKLTQLTELCNESRFSRENFKFILQQQGDINFRAPATLFLKTHKPEYIGCTSLHFAVHARNIKALDILLDHDIDFTIKNLDGFTALHLAIVEDFTERFNSSKLLINSILSAQIKRNNTENICDKNGLSHLHGACITNNVNALEFFLDNGASVNQLIGSESTILPGSTALHVAVKYGAFDAVKVLLEYGANLFLKDLMGMTPIHLTIDAKMKGIETINGKSKIIEDLIQNIKINDQMLRLLLKNVKPNSTAIDEYNFTVVHAVCAQDELAITRHVLGRCRDLDHSVSLDSPFWPGWTPLHFAAVFNIDVFDFLLKNGADMLFKNAKGETPLAFYLDRYAIEDVYGVMTFRSTWMNITFSNSSMKLLDLIFAMRNPKKFKSFLKTNIENIDARLPADSPLWPGLTILHLAVMFSERSNIYYDPEDNSNNDSDFPLIKVCLRKSAVATVQDVRGWSPIHLAFRQEKINVVKLLLGSLQTFSNFSDEDNLSISHIVCATSDVKSAKKLLLDINDVNITYTGESQILAVMPGSTPLHSAVIQGNFVENMMEIMIENGADIYAKDKDGMTPIHRILFSNGHFKIAEFLFSSLSDIHDRIVKKCQLSHLHIASFFGNEVMVEKLLDNGSDINLEIVQTELPFTKKYEGFTPLNFATSISNTGIVKLLLSRGADIFIRRPDGMSSLFDVFSRGMYRDCLDAYITTINESEVIKKRLDEEYGITMLHVACFALDTNRVTDLLRKGLAVDAEVYSCCPIWKGCTPLHVTMIRTQVISEMSDEFNRNINAVIALLVDYGADVTKQNDKLDTPVHMAADQINSYNFCEKPLVQYLLSAQKNFHINPTSSQGVSHFHIAATYDCFEFYEKFLTGGAEVNQTLDFFLDRRGGFTLLHMISFTMFDEPTVLKAIDLLLEYGADVNAKDGYGHTPLHYNVLFDASEAVFLKFIEHGVDLQVKSLGGQSVAEILLLESEVSTKKLKLLFQHGHCINVFNPVWQSGLMTEIMNKNRQDLIDVTFEAIKNNPQLAAKDKMGRTIIHNMVSANDIELDDIYYASFVQKFEEVARCNIDDQDNSGRTALHLATMQDNKTAVSALLMDGADINVLDFKGRSAVEYSVQYRRKQAFTILMTHVRRLKKVHLEVRRETIQNYIILALVNVGNEMEMTRNITIADSFTLYDFLSETGAVAAYPMMIPSKRRLVYEFFGSLDKNEFPELKYVFGLQFRKCISRLSLIKPSVKALKSVSGFQLSEDCCYLIVRYLPNSDMKRLISSA